MPTTAKQKISQDKVIPAVLELLEKYVDTTGSILDSYENVREDMIGELSIADKNLEDSIKNIETDSTAEALTTSILKHEDFDAEDFFKAFVEEHGSIDIHNFFVSQGYAVIKIDSIDQQAKLQQFVESEIWPLFSDRCKWEI